MNSFPLMRPATGESGIVAASRFNVQFVSFASDAARAGFGGTWLVMFAADFCSFSDAPAIWLVSAPADLKILPRNANTAAPAAQTSRISTIAATGKPSTGAVGLGSGIFGTGRSPAFVPAMMNFVSSVAGACGTVIFWKHVGHSITEPLCDESHLMCWPHTGQAYLNSAMAV